MDAVEVDSSADVSNGETVLTAFRRILGAGVDATSGEVTAAVATDGAAVMDEGTSVATDDIRGCGDDNCCATWN